MSEPLEHDKTDLDTNRKDSILKESKDSDLTPDNSTHHGQQSPDLTKKIPDHTETQIFIQSKPLDSAEQVSAKSEPPANSV